MPHISLSMQVYVIFKKEVKRIFWNSLVYFSKPHAMGIFPCQRLMLYFILSSAAEHLIWLCMDVCSSSPADEHWGFFAV